MLLFKYLANVVRPYDPQFAGDMETAESWRGRTKKSGGILRSNKPPTPPPPPPAANTPEGPPGSIGNVGNNDSNRRLMDAFTRADQGVESEKGAPGETDISRRLSRAADVMRLGFILLLGAATTNALSFDTSTGNPLGWVFFALVIIWGIISFITPARWVPLVMGLISFPILIAMFSVAFEISSGPLQTS